MRLTREELEQVCGIAALAGQEIMRVYSGEFTAWTKADDSPLTEADLRADSVIRKGLTQAFPGLFIWSEESSSAQAQQPDGTFFLVDPLDGTKEFLKRNGEFTVNIALVHDHVPVAGVVGVPAQGEMFFASQGLGAWHRQAGCADTALNTAPCPDDGRALRILGSRSHGTEQLDHWLHKLQRPHSLLSVGSSLKFCRIAQGLADVYPRFGPTSQWDTAAGQAVLEQAGGAVRDARGNSLRYGLQLPVLNGNFVAMGDPGLSLPALLP